MIHGLVWYWRIGFPDQGVQEGNHIKIAPGKSNREEHENNLCDLLEDLLSNNNNNNNNESVCDTVEDLLSNSTNNNSNSNNCGCGCKRYRRR